MPSMMSSRDRTGPASRSSCPAGSRLCPDHLNRKREPPVPGLQPLPLPPAPVHEPRIPPELDEPSRGGVGLPLPELVDVLREEPDDEPCPLAIGAPQQQPHVGRLGGLAPFDGLAREPVAVRLLRDEPGLGDRERL